MGVREVTPKPCQAITGLPHTSMDAHSHHAAADPAALRAAISIYLPLCHSFAFDLPFQAVRGYLDSLALPT